MSIDVDAENIQEFCPHCGEELLIRISTAMDIWNGKKELKRKDLKYATQISQVSVDKKLNRTKRIVTPEPAIVILFALVLWFVLVYFKVVS